MDSILQTLLSWQFIIFGLAIAAIVFVFRKFIDFFLIKDTTSKWSKFWNDLMLPILPVILGPTAGFIFKTYPYPVGLVSTGDRIVFGLVSGLMSTLLYRIVKAMFVSKINSLIQTIQTTKTTQTTQTTSINTNATPTVTNAPIITSNTNAGVVTESEQITPKDVTE